MSNQDYKKVLITTAIDYTNDVIHVGHAYQKILSDSLARFYRKALGPENVYFLTGTDEFGTTNEKAAKARNLTPLEHVTDISKKNQAALALLNISYNRFIRTSDEDHQKMAAAFFAKVLENGDIYSSKYTGLYCEGCEAYKTLSELSETGQCLLHPTREIQKLEEENYFFKWSKYSSFLQKLLEDSEFVLPEGKRKEMLSFVKEGLADLPVTRPKYKVSWGIQAPNDPDQVIYVWFDALINYFTAAKPLGFWDESTKVIHVLGKDNARWHTLLWPAMLKSAGYVLPSQIYVHGFVNLNGEKISKSKGNIIRVDELVAKYGTDPVRFYFLKHGPIQEDVNITLDHIKEVYTSDLANALGNTVSRITKLAEKSGLDYEIQENSTLWLGDWTHDFKEYRVDQVIQKIMKELSDLEKHINEHKPWEITDLNQLHAILAYEINALYEIAQKLDPIIPETSKKIQAQLSTKQIKFDSPLFPRIL